MRQDAVDVRALTTSARARHATIHKHKPRPHQKSRGGCQNCKLRHVKCDQNRPHCKRCLSYGVHCNFITGIPELQIVAPGATHIIEPRYRALLAVKHDATPFGDTASLAQFQHNVAKTISFGKRLKLFQNEIVDLSHSSLSLKHAMISLTRMYDRHEMMWNRPATSYRRKIPALSEEEVGHWYLATACFNMDLDSISTNTAPAHSGIQEQAALCATSALLAVLSFCYIEATRFEEAWPLAGGLSPSSPEDLQWIKMSNGKLSAQALTRGLAADPVFHPLVSIDQRDQSTFPSFAAANTPDGEGPFLNFSQSACMSEVDAFMQVAHSNSVIAIIFSFWAFVGNMTTGFEYDLRRKKPEALLILVHWYAKLNPIPVWWLKTRTTLEGQAICVYLNRYHCHDDGINRQLRWPISVLFGSP